MRKYLYKLPLLTACLATTASLMAMEPSPQGAAALSNAHAALHPQVALSPEQEAQKKLDQETFQEIQGYIEDNEECELNGYDIRKVTNGVLELICSTYPDLKVLDLPGCIYITDLSPITKLKNLEYLFLWNSCAGDLSPLRSLKNLKSLVLSETRAKDLSPLSELKNLTSLSLNDMRYPGDFSPLKELTNLTQLFLYHAYLSSLSKEDTIALSKILTQCCIYRFKDNGYFWAGRHYT